MPARGDQRVGGHPRVDVHGGGVQRSGADLAVRRLNLTLRQRNGDDDYAAVLAVRVVVDVAGHRHDMVGDGRQRDELLDALDLEAVTDRADLGPDDLQVRSARLLGGADAQHSFAADGLLGDVAKVVRLAEPAQDRDRRVVQAHPDADAGRSQHAELPAPAR